MGTATKYLHVMEWEWEYAAMQLYRKEFWYLVHKSLERFIARQDNPPIVQWLHTFTPATMRPWDNRKVCIDNGRCLGIRAAANRGHKFCCNIDFVEDRCSACQSDSSEELRWQGRNTQGFYAISIV
jgi:hypothetical protein